MIAFFPREDHLLFGPSEAVVHKLHGPQSGIDGGGAAGGEEDIVQSPGAKSANLLAKIAPGWVTLVKGEA